MKLVKLTCDHSSFHPIEFNPAGVTLIIGDGAPDHQHEGSSNGVGKTLLLYLVHHCLGARTDPRLKMAVPKWNFRLKIEHAGTEHDIERLGDGNHAKIDGSRISQTDLLAWLNESGAFQIDPGAPGLTFRSLIKRFARYKREDCVDPLRMNKETDFEALFRSIYLLGMDYHLALSKRQSKLTLDEINEASDVTKNDVVLRDIFRTGSQPRLRLEWLDVEIPKLRAEIEGFQIAEDYRKIELQANQLTTSMREVETRISVLLFQEGAIEKSLAYHPDITREDLISLYGGLGEIFKPEALRHFDQVEAFRASLAANRKKRLAEEKSSLAAQRSQLEAERRTAAQRRDEALNSLVGKKALDEYAAVSARLAEYEEERKRIRNYLSLSAKYQEKLQETREKQVEEDRLTTEYLSSDPLAAADQHFKFLAKVMFPNAPAGIVVENNINDSQLRYRINIEIEGDDSDGINSARILAFDWLLLMHGTHHNISFLWHDNRLFADIDPKSRAFWFVHALKSIKDTGKQYIAALNTENYDAMREFLSDEQSEQLEASIALRLRGDDPSHKLLGIQFG
jgi:uncharacterized protein YydD (DUF2326 family)